MASKIYTKTGDKGTTSLFGGTKVPKSHLRIEAYGTVDELNSFIGLLCDQLALASSAAPAAPAVPSVAPSSAAAPAVTSIAPSSSAASAATPAVPSSPATQATTPPVAPADFSSTLDTLHEMQDRLLTIGSSLATEKTPAYRMPELLPEDIQHLENAIDAMDTVLPPLKSFVLPGGHITVSTAHVTRCICRRAERCCVRMQEEKLPVEPLVIPYLNRLSDYLFTVARYAAHLLNAPEIPWLPRK